MFELHLPVRGSAQIKPDTEAYQAFPTVNILTRHTVAGKTQG